MTEPEIHANDGAQQATPEVLLKEYEMCQQEATSSATRMWLIIAVILVGQFAAITQASGGTPSVARILLLVVGLIASIVAAWFVHRFNQRAVLTRKVMFARQRKIEEELEAIPKI